MVFAIVITLILMLVTLNLVATFKIIKDTLFEKQQKIWQAIFVWLLPLFGALAVLMVHRKLERVSGEYSTNPTLGYSDSNLRLGNVADDILD